MATQAFLVAALAIGSYAQFSSSSGAVSSSSTTGSPVAAQTTMNLFIDADTDERWVGSVIAADSCETTYGLYCTEGGFNGGFGNTACDPNAIIRATYGPGFFELSTEAESGSQRATLVESCSLDGTTKAVCMASVSLSIDGEHTASSTTVTRTGGNVNYFQVPITAGASKLSGLAKCTETINAAAATGAVDVYKVLVVPGAAAVLAGLNAFA